MAAGERIRQDMLQVGQARPGYQLVTRLLGEASLKPAHGGWMPCSDALLSSIS